MHVKVNSPSCLPIFICVNPYHYTELSVFQFVFERFASGLVDYWKRVFTFSCSIDLGVQYKKYKIKDTYLIQLQLAVFISKEWNSCAESYSKKITSSLILPKGLKGNVVVKKYKNQTEKNLYNLQQDLALPSLCKYRDHSVILK